jgi:hypothetical protein
MEKRPCHMQVSLISTISFLKAIKKSRSYCLLTLNKQHRINKLSLGNRKITLCDIAPNSGVSVGNVETIIQEHLLLKKVCAH